MRNRSPAPTRPLFVRAIAAAILCTLLTACTSDAVFKHREQTPWTRTDFGTISITHPASWHARRFDESGSFTTGLAFLSNSAMRPPCVKAVGMTACSGLPHANLDAGDVVIAWFSNGFPMPSGFDLLAHTSGRLTRIAGHPAKIARHPATRTCKSDGGTVEVTATIATGPAADNITMQACLSHPSAALMTEVLRSLQSLRQ